MLYIMHARNKVFVLRIIHCCLILFVVIDNCGYGVRMYMN